MNHSDWNNRRKEIRQTVFEENKKTALDRKIDFLRATVGEEGPRTLQKTVHNFVKKGLVVSQAELEPFFAGAEKLERQHLSRVNRELVTFLYKKLLALALENGIEEGEVIRVIEYSKSITYRPPGAARCTNCNILSVNIKPSRELA